MEETWEVFCAARHHDRTHLREELGDVLYTVVFLTLLAERKRWFTLKALLRQTQRKMIRRHPHVFGAKQAQTAQDAYAHWQAAKQQERRHRRASSPTHQLTEEARQRLRPILMALWEELRQELHTSQRPRSKRSVP